MSISLSLIDSAVPDAPESSLHLQFLHENTLVVLLYRHELVWVFPIITDFCAPGVADLPVETRFTPK